ncbi:DNA methyltransferase [Burkholderia multivorans]|uniref:DNA methyltransferase n=1 Tax=Burkholderia multivorans TaxID=87883 RepID=UPI0021C1A1C4|nr:DNA methyltransferase [Burkholderia multivorans]
MTTPYSLHIGDCRTVLKTIADASIDAIVTDPPYELGFMGRDWDRSGVANDVSVWAECLRVLKPGGHLLAFSGSRTYHRMACAIEDAGFELRDQIMWLYGSGFPKSLDVSKAIDKALGVEGAYGAPKSAAHAGWIDRGRMRGADGDDGW